MTDKHKRRIGVALGSGSARGWAHIGALKQLAELGIRPDIVSGCSIGALVGAAYAVDNLDKLEKWVLSLTKFEMMRFFELNTSLNGFVREGRLRQYFHDHVCAREQSIEGLKRPFATVATSLYRGREVWLTEGKVLDAVWASISLPGLFPPFAHHEQWLVDGGLVNPVPVSLCRAMGAEVVIAVNLNSNTLLTRKQQKALAEADQRHSQTEKADSDTTSKPVSENSLVSSMAASLRQYSGNLLSFEKDENPMPGVMDTIMGSIYIMQEKITRSRMVGDPPEILLNARLRDIGLLEFYRAEEAIEEGKQCVLRMQAEIEHMMAEYT